MDQGALLHSDCLTALKKLESNSVDSLVTDPPAGISFMGKDWDSAKGGRDQWIAWMTEVMSECHRVMKPGAHGLVWAIPRTSHWTATALENAGFEVRDVVTHLFGSGFPKSLDISKAIDKRAGAQREKLGPKSTYRKPQEPNGWDCTKRAEFETAPATTEAKQWSGWGTALKPASEHWILVRKPCSEKTVAANVLRWGCGGLNIDGSRIGTDTIKITGGRILNDPTCTLKPINTTHVGRFPANLILDEVAAELLDQQSGIAKPKPERTGKIGGKKIHDGGWDKDFVNTWVADPGGGASRFFYVAKASKRERGEGNNHPTVKSLKLMQYLITLITPPNGVVLDPFMGSGSTGVAAKKLGFKFIGIEREKEYFEIAAKRVGA